MSNPNPARVSAGVPDGGRFAPNSQHEATVDLTDDGPTAEDTEQLAALYRDARIASEANARFELGSAKMLAQGVLRQWPNARYLVLIESDQGTGSHYPQAVLASIDPNDTLAYLEDEDLVNGANPAELGANMTTDGPWTAYATRGPDTHLHLDLHAVAAASLDSSTAEPATSPAVITPQYQYVDPATGRDVDLLTMTKTSAGRGSRTPVTGWYYTDDDEPMAGTKPWSGSPDNGQLDLAVRRVTNRPELQAQSEQQIGAVVRQMIPEAEAWSAGTRETSPDTYEFADNEIVVTKTDSSQEYLDLQWADQSPAAEARRAQVKEALKVLSDLAGESLSEHDAHTVIL